MSSIEVDPAANVLSFAAARPRIAPRRAPSTIEEHEAEALKLVEMAFDMRARRMFGVEWADDQLIEAGRHMFAAKTIRALAK